MSRLFISHCVKDREAAERLIDFLVLGMGVSRNDIFCTSENGTLPTGQPFVEHIRNALSDCEQVLCFLTPNYLCSKFCLAEMGAAWFQMGKIIPLLVEPIHHSDLNGTPLLGLQMLNHESQDDLMSLYDDLRLLGIARNTRTAEFNRQLKKYTAMIQDTQFVSPDAEGYYCVKIQDIRKVPPQYKCYKLEKLLKLDDIPAQKETHWLFYLAGSYENLTVGDTVKFKVRSTEVRDFSDIKAARNIYPEHLSKI